MNQKRKFRRDFSFGGYAIFEKGDRMPAFVQVEGSKIFKVSIPKKEDRRRLIFAFRLPRV